MLNQNWALALAYWLHLLASVTWIGGLVTLAWIVPAARRTLSPETYQTLVGKLQSRLQSLGWFSLVILLKQLIITGMAAISAYLTWGITPSLQRAAFRQARGLETSEDQASTRLKLQQREQWLLNLNLVMAVLALMALARAS